MTLLATKDGVQVADFEFGFVLDGKAVVTEENGDFFIEGLASDFGLDRQDEAFEPGAFEEGLKSYMSTNPILLYHHKTDTALGKVVNAELTTSGLHVKAQIDSPEPGTIVADYVRKIKNGTLKAFSVGGKFYRRMTEDGPRIFKADLREISVTPLAVNPRTLFAVAGKAFETVVDPQEEAAMKKFAESLAAIDAVLTEAEENEGKAAKKEKFGTDNAATNSAKNQRFSRGHPDAAPVAGLLMHMVHVHTLAENTQQNAADPEVAKVAGDAVKSMQKHTAALHHIAARIGPLPDYYGPLA